MKNPTTSGDQAKSAMALKREINTERAAQRRANGTFNETQKYLHIMPEVWDHLLERITSGEIDNHICRALGIDSTSLRDKRRRDPDFAKRYMEAMEAGYVALAQDSRLVARGVEGYSSGDLQRDRLIVKTDLALAKHFAPKIFGDRMQIDHNTVQVNLPDWAIRVSQSPALPPPDEDDDEDDDEGDD